MEVGIEWLAILGFAFGFAAFLRWIFEDIVNYTRRPKLVISHGPFTINWQSIDTDETRRFVHLEVKSKKGVAQKCTAKARIIKHPDNVTILQREVPLHWADTPYGTVSTEPVDIKTEVRRLDIAYTTSRNSGQSWLAAPLALITPGKAPHATLPPGEYVLEIIVSCENGRGDTRKVRLVSSQNWQGLQAEKV